MHYDLLMAGLRLEDLNWLDLRAVVRYSPRTSALYRAAHPEWQIDNELLMLREIEFSTRVLRWQNTKDGHDGINTPKPILLTDAERRAAKTNEQTVGDPLPIGDMLAWLGWSKPSPN